MEIRTCEEYVIGRVFDLEKENEELKESNDCLEADLSEALKELANLKLTLRKVVQVKKSDKENDDGYRWLNIDCFERWNNEEFRIIMNAIGGYDK